MQIKSREPYVGELTEKAAEAAEAEPPMVGGAQNAISRPRGGGGGGGRYSFTRTLF